MAYTFLLKYVANPAEQEKLVSPEHEVCTPSLDIGIDFSSTENAMKVSNAFNSFLAYGENKREFLGGCTYRWILLKVMTGNENLNFELKEISL